MEIHVKESTIIRPAQETPNKCLWLSTLDFMFGVVHAPLVYFYRPPRNGSSNVFESSVLKQALSNVLVPFYPLAGRLERDDDGRLEVHCNAQGAVFIEAETSFVIDDFPDFAPSSKIRQLVPTFDTSKDISSYPLLAVQVTHFKCGGVSLGVLIHHTVVDGTSAFHFINSWAEMTYGLSISTMPFIDRTILRELISYPTFPHIEYDLPPTPDSPPVTTKSQVSQHLTCTAIIKISCDHINTLKSMSTFKNGGTITTLSTYEIVTAHIWCCMCKARELSDDQESRLYIPINGRPRFNPPLPPSYFGNVILYCTPITTSGDLRSKHLISTAERIHAEMKKIDDEYLKSALSYLEQRPDRTDLRRMIIHLSSPNLLIVSWVQLHIHDANFGWGRPVYMGPASIDMEGCMYLLPSTKNDGSLDLIICLEAHQIQRFKRFFNFEFLRSAI